MNTSLTAQCDQLALEQSELGAAMRAARATLLGLSLDQLLAYDNRQTLIRQKMREHGLSFEDAESYVRDMEQDARRERQERQSEDLSGWERALVQRNHGPDWEPPV